MPLTGEEKVKPSNAMTREGAHNHLALGATLSHPEAIAPITDFFVQGAGRPLCRR